MMLKSTDSEDPKLIAANYCFWSILTYVIIIPQRYRRTDGQLAVA